MLIALIIIAIGFLIIFLGISQTIYSSKNIKRILQEIEENPNKVYLIGAGKNTIEIEGETLIYIFGKDKKMIPLKAIPSVTINNPTSMSRGKLIIAASEFGGNMSTRTDITIVFCDVDAERANKIANIILESRNK